MSTYNASLLAITVAASLIGPHPAAAAEPTTSTRPNIIFIISDDQRWDCIGAAGNPNIKTPNIDRLATEGLHFKEATIHVPQCSPARAQLLTGMPPQSTGWYSNQTRRADLVNANGFKEFDLLPEVIHKAGYHTALAGKWHITTDPWNCGFKEIGTWMPAGAGPYKNPKLARGNTRETSVTEGFTQTLIADSAIELIKNNDTSSAPLFLWTAFTAPHTPLVPNPPPSGGMYSGKKREELAPSTFEKEGVTGKDAWANYYEAITALDVEVGRIMEAVKNSKAAANTMIVLLGDNGYMMGARDWSGKVVPYEGSIRVPLVMWGAGVKGKGPTDASASSLDLPPTFALLAGATPPARWAGRDLRPVLADGKPHDITWSVSEFADPKNHKFGPMSYRTLRTTESKLILWNPGSRPNEFYNLASDPLETNNLYGNPTVAEKQKAMEEQLKAWMKKNNDDWSISENLKLAEMKSADDADETPGKKGKRAARKAKKAAGDPE